MLEEYKHDGEVSRTDDVVADEEPEPAPAVEALTEVEMADTSADPFQRRIDNALRQGFGGRDSRVLSLGLNGLLTRA